MGQQRREVWGRHVCLCLPRRIKLTPCPVDAILEPQGLVDEVHLSHPVRLRAVRVLRQGESSGRYIRTTTHAMVNGPGNSIGQ